VLRERQSYILKRGQHDINIAEVKSQKAKGSSEPCYNQGTARHVRALEW